MKKWKVSRKGDALGVVTAADVEKAHEEAVKQFGEANYTIQSRLGDVAHEKRDGTE